MVERCNNLDTKINDDEKLFTQLYREQKQISITRGTLSNPKTNESLNLDIL